MFEKKNLCKQYMYLDMFKKKIYVNIYFQLYYKIKIGIILNFF